jgi:hypothetical protein
MLSSLHLVVTPGYHNFYCYYYHYYYSDLENRD